MVLNGKQYGVKVEGTHLLFHGPAPRRSAADRNRQGWYECSLCGELFSCRINDVRPSKQVSCGCKGRKLYKNHMEARAGNYSRRVRAQVFRLRLRRRKAYVSVYAIAAKLGIDKVVVDFLYAMHCRIIEELAAMGDRGWSVMTKLERAWLRRHTSRTTPAQRAHYREVDRQHAEAGWQQRLIRAGVAWEQIQAAKQISIEEFQAMMLDPGAEVLLEDEIPMFDQVCHMALREVQSWLPAWRPAAA